MRDMLNRDRVAPCPACGTVVASYGNGPSCLICGSQIAAGKSDAENSSATETESHGFGRHVPPCRACGGTHVSQVNPRRCGTCSMLWDEADVDEFKLRRERIIGALEAKEAKEAKEDVLPPMSREARVALRRKFVAARELAHEGGEHLVMNALRCGFCGGSDACLTAPWHWQCGDCGTEIKGELARAAAEQILGPENTPPAEPAFEQLELAHPSMSSVLDEEAASAGVCRVCRYGHDSKKHPGSCSACGVKFPATDADVAAWLLLRDQSLRCKVCHQCTISRHPDGELK